MDLLGWSPFREMNSVGREIECRLSRTSIIQSRCSNIPRIDIIQKDTQILIYAEISGVSIKDLDVYVDSNSITISGQIIKPTDYNEEYLILSEIFWGSFSRTIPINFNLDPEKAIARFSNGLLIISAPRLIFPKSKGVKLEVHYSC